MADSMPNSLAMATTRPLYGCVRPAGRTCQLSAARTSHALDLAVLEHSSLDAACIVTCNVPGISSSADPA